MLTKRLLQISIFKTLLNPIYKLNFSEGKWRQRQQSAEKVYISTHQKKTLSKLLHKIEENQINADAKESQFQQNLKKIVAKYQVKNESGFIAEIINLHKNL